MVDHRFFSYSGAIALRDVASLTGARLASAEGAPPDGSRMFSDVAPLDRAGPDDISFLDNTKYVDVFAASKAGACFVRSKYAGRAPKGMALLIIDDPYYAYAVTAQRLYPEPEWEPGMAASAVVAKNAAIGEGVRIDAGAVIGEHAVLGNGCWIGANTVIGDHVTIGDRTRIGALCSISHAMIGQRVLLHRGIHIGQDGFGFAPGRSGIAKVPQLGRVIIGNDVEIGSGTCIDRGAGPDTVIGDGCKIDNLVMIGHNVQLGRHVIITGQCGISGSTKLGDGVMLGAQSGLAGHLTIGAGARLAARTGLMHDVPAGETWGGTPGMPVKQFFKQVAVLARLAKTKGDDR